MTQIKLTKEHIHALKSLSHSIKPVLIMGEKGMSDSFILEAKRAIEYHELIKIRIVAETKEEKKRLVNDLTTALNAMLIQHIGNVATLFKRNHESPVIFFKK